MAAQAQGALDGRRARSAKSREAIVDAAMGLLDGGDLKPTAATIASKAGVSVRSIFQHFSDLEDLFVAVSDRQAARVAELYASATYEGDLSSRIAEFVAYRSRLYETIAPIRRAALLHEPFSPTVASRLALTRTLSGIDLERAFGPELRAAREAGDATLGIALRAVSSFNAWDELRRYGEVDADAASAALRRAVEGLLALARH